MAIHFVKKQARRPLFLIAFLKWSLHNYQLDQVLEIFKYFFYFDGVTLSSGVRGILNGLFCYTIRGGGGGELLDFLSG